MRELGDGGFRYGFPTTDRRSIKVGVHHEGGEADPDSIDRKIGEDDLKPLREFAGQYLRGVTTDVVDSSVCMYTNTPDERFLAISPRELRGVTVLSACSGHGFKFAPVLGQLMAELILDGQAMPAIIRSA
jgi:sarcosine oxidase